MTRVAVLFYRLGPYHLARLRAAGRCLDVTAIEYAKVDSTYGWNLEQGADGFRRVTLFQDDTFEKARAAVVQARIAQALADARPEVVAIPGWGDRCSLAALQWCLQSRVPAVVMSDSTIWDKRRWWWKEWIKGRIIRQYSAGFVAGAPHASYLELLGMQPELVNIGFDVVDNRYFEEKAEECRRKNEECRKQYGLPERYFLTVSRFVDSKNLPRLLQAYAIYREKAVSRKQKAESAGRRAGTLKSEKLEADGPWDLVLLGDGPLRQKLKSQVAALNLNGYLHLPGFKQYGELPAYYGLAGVFILPSLPNETWGLVVNEAMASGLPVIVSTACGCSLDLVREGVNGFVFNPADSNHLVQLMLKVAAFDFPRSAFGRESQRIIAGWGLDRFAKGLSAATAKAIEAGPGRPNAAQRAILQALLWR